MELGSNPRAAKPRTVGKRAQLVPLDQGQIGNWQVSRFRLEAVASLAPTKLPASQRIQLLEVSKGGIERQPLGISTDPAKCCLSIPVACARLHPSHGSAQSQPELECLRLSPGVPLSGPEARPARILPQPKRFVQTLVGSSSQLAALQSGDGLAPPGVRSSWHVSRRPLAGRGVKPAAINWKTAHTHIRVTSSPSASSLRPPGVVTSLSSGGRSYLQDVGAAT